jgi:hyperosmotically inducible periplasmic protein
MKSKSLRLTQLLPAFCAVCLYAGTLSAQSGSTQSAPDNSAQNKHHTTTADDQSADQSSAQTDRETTAKIRKSIMADKDLSTYAHNVKIITNNGSVTLKGPVKSEDEKQKVATHAASVTSADKITNQLTVKQEKSQY